MQTLIVYLIVALCFLAAGWRMFQSFKQIRRNESPCSGCTSECALRNLTSQRHPECGKEATENGDCEEKSVKRFAGSKKSSTFAPQSRENDS